jgi:hypothetical protein
VILRLCVLSLLQVVKAIRAALQSTPSLKEKELEKFVKQVTVHFFHHLPKPTFGKRYGLMSHVEDHVIGKIEAQERALQFKLPSSQFVKTVALIAAKVASGTALDVLKKHSAGGNWKDAVIKVGLKTAQGNFFFRFFFLAFFFLSFFCFLFFCKKKKKP